MSSNPGTPLPPNRRLVPALFIIFRRDDKLVPAWSVGQSADVKF